LKTIITIIIILSFLIQGTSAIGTANTKAFENTSRSEKLIHQTATNTPTLDITKNLGAQLSAWFRSAKEKVTGGSPDPDLPPKGDKPDGTGGGDKEVSSWVYGSFKSESKWAGQLSKIGWTAEQITEAVTKGKSFNSVNMVNKANSATRYVHPTTGQSVVIDNVTKELLHVGGPGFKY
jgi:hypothetical protein